MFNYQDRADIVPKSTTLLGYRHTGYVIKLGKRRWVWPWQLADVHCNYGQYAEE